MRSKETYIFSSREVRRTPVPTKWLHLIALTLPHGNCTQATHVHWVGNLESLNLFPDTVRTSQADSRHTGNRRTTPRLYDACAVCTQHTLDYMSFSQANDGMSFSAESWTPVHELGVCRRAVFLLATTRTSAPPSSAFSSNPDRQPSETRRKLVLLGGSVKNVFSLSRNEQAMN